MGTGGTTSRPATTLTPSRFAWERGRAHSGPLSPMRSVLSRSQPLTSIVTATSDLATANHSGNTISILRGNGNGTFATASSLLTDRRPERRQQPRPGRRERGRQSARRPRGKRRRHVWYCGVLRHRRRGVRRRCGRRQPGREARRPDRQLDRRPHGRADQRLRLPSAGSGHRGCTRPRRGGCHLDRPRRSTSSTGRPPATARRRPHRSSAPARATSP